MPPAGAMIPGLGWASVLVAFFFFAFLAFAGFLGLVLALTFFFTDFRGFDFFTALALLFFFRFFIISSLIFLKDPPRFGPCFGLDLNRGMRDAKSILQGLSDT